VPVLRSETVPTPFQPASFLVRPDDFGVVVDAMWRPGLDHVPAPQLALARYQHLVVCEVNRKLDALQPLGREDAFMRDRRAASTFAARLTQAAQVNGAPTASLPVDVNALRRKLRGQATCTLEDVMTWALELGTDILVEVIGPHELLPPGRPYVRTGPIVADD
jgi:hypothetical protein